MKGRKNILAGCFLFLAMIAMTGCGVIELTEEESDMIAWYSAGTLLNHSEEYTDRLALSSPTPEAVEATEIPATEVPATEVPASEVPASEAPGISEEPESTPQESETTSEESETSTQEADEPEETPIPQVTLDELYQLDGVDITYKDYEFCKEYPRKSAFYQITASDDEILLVVKFKVTNKEGKKKRINLINRQISYPLTADESEYLPTISVLENGGLNFLDTKLKGNQSEEAVLVYAVPFKVRDAVTMSVAVQENGKEASVKMR